MCLCPLGQDQKGDLLSVAADVRYGGSGLCYHRNRPEYIMTLFANWPDVRLDRVISGPPATGYLHARSFPYFSRGGVLMRSGTG